MNTHTASEIKLMEEVCRIAAEAVQYTGKHVRAGITTNELDQIAYDFILSRGGKPACLGYYGYPKSICTSMMDVICHGLPDQTVLKEGDFLNIDLTVIKNGYHGDTSSMFFVGEPSPRAKALSECAFEAMHKGIEAVKAGLTTGDIGFAIEKYVTRKGLYVCRDIGGHGIGRKMHEDPWIPSFGKKGKGDRLLKWGTITVEPMVNETAAKTKELPIAGSDITICKTADGSWSAQYEHTVLITDGAPQILTLI